MKTLTEFFGMNLKQAAQTRKELIDSGKTPEELPAALGEALKLEGDRLNHLIHALDAVGTRLQDLKRVVVFSAQEGEKAPQKATQKGEHYYLVEYYPSLEKPKAQPKSFDRFGKGDKKGRKKRRHPRKGPAPEGLGSEALSASGGDQTPEGSEGQENRRRRPRRFPRRAPHPGQQPQVSTGRIIPRAEKLAMEAAAAANAQQNPTSTQTTAHLHETSAETQAKEQG